MNKFIKLLTIVVVLIFSLVGLIGFFTIIFNKAYFNNSHEIDADLASKFGDFFGGFIGTVFSTVSIFLLIYSVYQQNHDSKKAEVENNFFRMIDYHNQNVNQLKIPNLYSNKSDVSEGRRGFVQFKIQINRLLKIVEEVNSETNANLTKDEVLDVSYIIFYHCIDGSWISFIVQKLDRYPNGKIVAEKISEKINNKPEMKLARTNQTNLSAYFRNMYNAIKMVDESNILSEKQKKNIIKIYRAQLSNPELYIIFFNVLSRFGKKWKENRYIEKYELLKNIPRNYCDGYEPESYFPMAYEDDEY